MGAVDTLRTLLRYDRKSISLERVVRTPPKTLFVCDFDEALRSTVLPLSTALEADGEFSPHIVLEGATEAMVEMCEDAEVPFTCRGRAPLARWGERRQPKPPSTISWSAKMLVNVARARRQIRSIRDELDRHQPATLVLLDDRSALMSHWVRAAQLANVPTIVVQWAAVHHAEAMLSLRAAQQQTFVRPRVIGWLEDRIADLVPQAVAEHEGHRVWYLSADQVLAGWANKSFPQLAPWSYGGGNADVVAAMGVGWKQRMVAGGVDAEKIVVTGHPDQDRWLDTRREIRQQRPQVFRQLGVSPQRRLITVVAPALATRRGRGVRRGGISLEEVQVSLRAAIARVVALGDEFVPVVKVHPRDRVSDLNFLRGLGEQVQVVRDVDTTALIAASDAMTCQWSTTVMIGQAVRTPVAVFDFYQSPSARMWNGIRGLPVARNNSELTNLLTEILRSDSDHSELVKLQQEFVDEYLCLDGRCTQRLVDLIKQRASQRLDTRDVPLPRAA